MGKLHEVLAVDRDLELVARKIADEAIATFTKKTEHFVGIHKRLEMFDEGRKQEEQGQEEFKALTTTVQAKLEYCADHFVKHLDCVAQKEVTNTYASASVEILGKPFLPAIPATLLLSLENKLTQWRAVYEAIPTLEPNIEWTPDSQQGKNVYRALHDVVRHKTEKTITPIVLYHATDKHPAQVKENSIDQPVGNYIAVQWSGKVTPARKSELLGRIDLLISEIKKARQRANSVDAASIEIGQTIFDFINNAWGVK